MYKEFRQLNQVDIHVNDRVFCGQSMLCDWKWDRLAALELFRDTRKQPYNYYNKNVVVSPAR